MSRRPPILIALGAGSIVLLALIAARTSADTLAGRLSEQAERAIRQTGSASVSADFFGLSGFPSRHPLLSGGEGLSEAARDRIAKTVAAIPGVGGIRWADGSALASSQGETFRPLNCQEDVQALLRTRTIRFEESSSRIDMSSRDLVNEVADALRPCLGSIIAITGHTDASGEEPGNLALSRERADAVRDALIRRGIPADGLRTQGVGSAQPVEGLDPLDPANRRIEFTVIETVPVKPTPVDTPGPR